MPASLPPATAAGAYLRQAREAAGLSQTTLALRLGAAQATLSRWEHSGPVRAVDLHRLAVVLADYDEVHALTLILTERPSSPILPQE